MLDTWQHALTTTLDDVSAHTDRAMLVSTVPVYTSPEFDSTLLTLLRPSGREFDVAVDDVETWRSRFLAAEQRAMDASTLPVTVVDPMPVVCMPERCSVRREDGLFIYRVPEPPGRTRSPGNSDLSWTRRSGQALA